MMFGRTPEEILKALEFYDTHKKGKEMTKEEAEKIAFDISRNLKVSEGYHSNSKYIIAVLEAIGLIIFPKPEKPETEIYKIVREAKNYIGCGNFVPVSVETTSRLVEIIQHFIIASQ